MPTVPKNVIKHLRCNWKTKGGTLLSYGSDYSKIDDVFSAVGKSAYRPSIQRGGTNITACYPNQKERYALRDEVANYLSKRLKEIYPKKCLSFDDFTEWEEKTATYIRDFYRNKGVCEYTYGNAQKLINMAIKYFLSSDLVDEEDPLFENCHFPVDAIIQKKLNDDFNIPYLANKNHSWSRNDSWKDFVKYQKTARKIILSNGYYSPLICEISEWQ